MSSWSIAAVLRHPPGERPSVDFAAHPQGRQRALDFPLLGSDMLLLLLCYSMTDRRSESNISSSAWGLIGWRTEQSPPGPPPFPLRLPCPRPPILVQPAARVCCLPRRLRI